MIFDTLIEFLISPVTWLINLLPDLDFPAFNATLLADVFDLFRCLGYVIPWAGLLPIFTCSLTYLFFRLTWAVILRVKSFIPTLGGT